MYEDQTYDIILERMMNRVSDKIDKRPSSPQPRQSYRVSSHQQTLMLLESVSTLVKSTML